MPRNVILEICAESVDRAVAAERGGADRIELCGDLSVGGITPDIILMLAARKRLQIPVYAMIRPRPGDFVYSEDEFAAMKRSIRQAKDLGMSGLVLGILDSANQIDRARTATLVELAHPLPVTFHRAFDLCPDLTAALQAVIATGAKRILTSGGKKRVVNALAPLADLIATAQDRVVVMPGGGVRASNVRRILRHTGACEIHSSLDDQRNALRSIGHATPDTKVVAKHSAVEFEAVVRQVRNLMKASPSAQWF